jgi:hypothetical protein
MGFRAALAAALSGGLLVATAASAAAQQAAAPPSAIVRFPLGVQFEIPQGWSVRDLRFGPDSNSAVVSRDPFQPRGRSDSSARNPNELSVVFNGGTPSPQASRLSRPGPASMPIDRSPAQRRGRPLEGRQDVERP